MQHVSLRFFLLFFKIVIKSVLFSSQYVEDVAGCHSAEYDPLNMVLVSCLFGMLCKQVVLWSPGVELERRPPSGTWAANKIE